MACKIVMKIEIVKEFTFIPKAKPYYTYDAMGLPVFTLSDKPSVVLFVHDIYLVTSFNENGFFIKPCKNKFKQDIPSLFVPKEYAKILETY